MPSLPSTSSEADVVCNRASVALAKSQRLIASWLPPPTASELASAKFQAEIEKEEQELFTPAPELYVRLQLSMFNEKTAETQEKAWTG